MATTRRTKRRHTTRHALARRAKDNLEQMPHGGTLDVFRRLASDPKLTVEKLGELIKLQERIRDYEATTAFDTAYRIMLPKIPKISKRGAIRNKQGEIQSRYSRYEDIRKVVDPILLEHGFQLHTRTEWPVPGMAEVVGTLVHERGGRRESRFQSGSDPSGGKNAIQGLGSAVSYGKRYVTKDLLQIVEEGEDDDAQKASTRKATPHTAEERQAAVDHPPADHVDLDQPITDLQLRRFHTLVSNSGRTSAEVKAWLERKYGLKSSKGITRRQYESICSAIEGRGDLR